MGVRLIRHLVASGAVGVRLIRHLVASGAVGVRLIRHLVASGAVGVRLIRHLVTSGAVGVRLIRHLVGSGAVGVRLIRHLVASGAVGVRLIRHLVASGAVGVSLIFILAYCCFKFDRNFHAWFSEKWLKFDKAKKFHGRMRYDVYSTFYNFLHKQFFGGLNSRTGAACQKWSKLYMPIPCPFHIEVHNMRHTGQPD